MKKFNKGTYTIDSREVAKMVNKEHKNLLRDIRNYIKDMNEVAQLNFEPGEFFQQSNYFDENQQPRPSYQITKKGCEFISNKLTGKKGTLFTAAYINRFHEMEQALSLPQHETTKAFSIGEVASMTKILITTMRKQGSSDHEIAQQVELTCKQFGVEVLPHFIKPKPRHKQLGLFEASE